MNFTSLFIKMARNIHKGNNLHSCFCFFGKNTTPLKMRDHLREMRDHRSINLSKNIKKLNWLKSNRVKGRNRASFETGRAPIHPKSSSQFAPKLTDNMWVLDTLNSEGFGFKVIAGNSCWTGEQLSSEIPRDSSHSAL